MSPITKSIRIIVVDDEPFMLNLLTQALVQLGHSDVIACESGEQGLVHLNAANPPVDLILLDINMPGMDGVEFMRRLAEYRYAGGVVLVSGEDERIVESIEKLVKAHRLNSIGRLRKPVKLKELQKVLGRLHPTSDASMARRAAEPMVDVTRLRAAIAAGELVNFYQPKVALTTGEAIGVEALVRWQPPGEELILPAQFIALAEEHRLITEITHAVLRSAMQHVSAWQRAGYELTIAVNVSMQDLTALDFPDAAAALARQAGVEPNLVTFEVTETQVMSNISTVLDVLSRLRLRRFRLAIDDFGTGHSSLAQLRDLPFNELKIDRSFVDGASSETTLRTICRASLQMAQQLKLDTVAEGIDSADDWQTLFEMGCTAGQGYGISRPMPANNVVAWLNEWSAQLRGSIDARA